MEEGFGELQLDRKDLNPYYLQQLFNQMGLLLVDLVITMEEDFGEHLVDRKDLNLNYLHYQPQNQN
jgi:hypothetical protein